MNTKLMALMEKLLPLLVRRISDELKDEIVKAVRQIEKCAREKPGNSFDFFFAEILKEILDIHLPKMEKEIEELPDQGKDKSESEGPDQDQDNGKGKKK